MSARTEERNRAARESLEPLGPSERPLAVTIGAVISALVGLSVIVAYALGATVNGSRPPLAQLIVPVVLTTVMAVGMWRARYWAVLGFQAVLALLIVAAALGLVAAKSAGQLIGNTALIVIAGTLFYLMIKALARIQMPQRDRE
ncbi:MAG: hypothetical protein ACRDK1_11095 [Solirubrobacterales bacterium]